jgi:hypothetical protein
MARSPSAPCLNFPKSKPPSAACALSRRTAADGGHDRPSRPAPALSRRPCQRLTGATVTGLSRRAKYGIVSTDRDDHMIFHLGMSGRWRTEGGEAGKHDHLLIETAGHRLFLHDPRRFGSVDLVSGDPLATFPAFVALGPEPLSDASMPPISLKALTRAARADQGDAARSDGRCGARQYLCVRGAQHGAHFADQACGRRIESEARGSFPRSRAC